MHKDAPQILSANSYLDKLNCKKLTDCLFDLSDARSMPSHVGDVRGHWVDTRLLGENRVVFDTGPSPDKARLKIANVSETDDGLYRCRVDFSASQTRTSRLNLTVVGKLDAANPKILSFSYVFKSGFFGNLFHIAGF